MSNRCEARYVDKIGNRETLILQELSKALASNIVNNLKEYVTSRDTQYGVEYNVDLYILTPLELKKLLNGEPKNLVPSAFTNKRMRELEELGAFEPKSK